jgi:predicted Zn-dependent protease
MNQHFADRIYQGKMTRRDFIQLMMISTAGVAVGGCAVNPVSGDRQLMLLSEQQEIDIDKEQSPHQFSSDYGVMQDSAVNRYISEVSQQMAARSHRPNMPYNFNAVNATYINAYAFPGGTVAATRGILVELDNEAELAGLMGHELGHINARHSAQRATQGILSDVLLSAGTAIVGTNYGNVYADVVQTLGSVASGALLARYSRDNEREADSLGMTYMTRAEQNPEGMVGLMEVLVNQSKTKPNALEQMFASHPLSSERYNTAKQNIASNYQSQTKLPLNRERYMDSIASLRQIKPAIIAMQQGEQQMGKEAYQVAESNFNTALQHAPEDYAGLVMMAKCQLALKQNDKAQRYVDKAKQINPNEAQAQHISGLTMLAQNQPDAANDAFRKYERLLPGNPNTIFLQAVSLESMQKKSAAAQQYGRYLREVKQNTKGMQAQHAAQRLQSWGYVK